MHSTSSRRITPSPSFSIGIPKQFKYSSYPTSPSSSSQENSPKNLSSSNYPTSPRSLLKRCYYCLHVFQPRYTKCGDFICSLECKYMFEKKYSRNPKPTTSQLIQSETEYIPTVYEHTSGIGRVLSTTKL